LPVYKSTLIRSKLLIPNPAGLLHRPRICQSIEQGLSRKLTIISAPAGYGKTSVLADFAQHSPVPVCWYTADERDRDLGIFIEYLIGAIGEQFPDFGTRTQSALVSQSADLFQNSANIVGELVNEILEIDVPFAVVIDNYEVVDGSFGLSTFIHHLFQVLPANCHLMIGSRALPDVPIADLVAKYQLVGLTARDLRFTPREVQSLLRLSQIEIPETRAEMITANSEGWITGILLLANTLREEAETLLDAEKATTDTYNYLAMSVLNRQSPDIQHFLYTSSILREMSLRQCHEILQIGEPRTLLAEVERRNLFITRFGKGGTTTYRYHNLFRDFVHEQLQHRDPVRYVELHRRAAEWFEQDNDVEESVYHYLVAKDHSHATTLMERVAVEWFTRGRIETLLRWTKELPREIRKQAPRLALHHSRVLTDRYDYEAAQKALVDAEAGFAAQKDTIGLAKVDNQRALLSLFEGHYQDALAIAQKVLGVLDKDEVTERANARRHIGKAYVGLGRFAEGVPELQEALALYRQVGNSYSVVNLLQDLTFAFTAQGHFDKAVTCLNEALVISRRLGTPAQLSGVLNNFGWIHHMRGKYQEALMLYEEGLVAARRGDDLRWQAYISAGIADVYRDIGVYKRASPFYEAGWRMAQDKEPGLALYILAAQADMYRWQEDYTQAFQLLKQARQIAEEKETNFEQRGLLPTVEGITLVENGEVEAGIKLLSEATEFLEQHQMKSDLARARFLQAKAHLLAGDRSQAVAELSRAMKLASEIGTHQFAVAEGQHAESLLRLGAKRSIAGCKGVIKEIQQLGVRDKEQRQKTEKDMTDRLRIYALGEGQVVRNGHAGFPSEWQAVTIKELFFYILLHGPLERDAIGLVFWPDLPAKRVSNNFHSMLRRLRLALGADVVIAEDGRYRLGDVDYWFDVEEFEALVERARLLPHQEWQTEDLWQRAIKLYRGDFLSRAERAWCVSKREALREMYIEALIGMGQCYKARRGFREAIDWYQRALEVDELQEDIYRYIMLCYSEAGQRAEALAQYNRYEEVLMEALGIEPSIEIRSLYKQIAGKGAD
jgi:LuxR family maltose regulon positive regulatory protein